MRCDTDGCNGNADTIHFTPWAGLSWDDKELQVLFACPQHDHGGYWFNLNEYLADIKGWDQHIREKGLGAAAQLGLLKRRLLLTP